MPCPCRVPLERGRASPYDTYEAGVGQWPHAPEWYPRENSNPDLHVRSVVSYPLNDGGKTLVVVQRIELCRAP